MVVNTSDANYFPLFCNGIRNFNGYAYIYGGFVYQNQGPLM